jgi:hypothetical protein
VSGEYDASRLESYSLQIKEIVSNCLLVEPNLRPDIVGVASLIAEKILTYTDTVRSRLANAEKKLERDNSRTQK